MSTIDRATLALLQGVISKDRRAKPEGWRDRVPELVRLWCTENMPTIPLPDVHCRLLQDAETGRWFARIRLSIRPLWMDIQIHEDTEP